MDFLRKIYSATRFGATSKIVEIESSFVRALPAFVISGSAENVIKEAKERVQAALSALNFAFPPLKITINLSPSHLPKFGSHFDLPIALLIALHKEKFSKEFLARTEIFAFGELGLNGDLKHNDGLFALLLDVMREKNAVDPKDFHVILPLSSKPFFQNIPNLKCHFAESLAHAVELVKSGHSASEEPENLKFPHIKIDEKKYFYSQNFPENFSEVRGQKIAKRAALISASGFHNIIFEGSAGCGKSMIARRMAHILPPLSTEELLENSRIKSLANENIALDPKRSFRSPHQSASLASIIGSVAKSAPMPGEVALAHQGILFFDELPYFRRSVLEAMREPLENNVICVSRAHLKIEFDASFLFVCAQNPCPCGNRLNPAKECRCSQLELGNYERRLSEPFLDRIDLFVEMVEQEDEKNTDPDSQTMQNAMLMAFVAQKSRPQKNFNGKMTHEEIQKFCALDPETEGILQLAVKNFGLSLRAIDKVKKVARTIADLAGSAVIQKSHLIEALSFRRVKRTK